MGEGTAERKPAVINSLDSFIKSIFKEDYYMDKKDIFLVITEDNQVIMKKDIGKIAVNGQIVYESDIDDLVETELTEGCHDDYIGDYESEIDFYLSNARKDTYKEYIKNILDDVRLNNEALNIIQEEVIKRIKNHVDIFNNDINLKVYKILKDSRIETKSYISISDFKQILKSIVDMSCKIEDNSFDRRGDIFILLELLENETDEERYEYLNSVCHGKEPLKETIYIKSFIYEYREDLNERDFAIEYGKRKICLLQFSLHLDINKRYDYIDRVKYEPIFSPVWECRKFIGEVEVRKYKKYNNSINI